MALSFSDLTEEELLALAAEAEAQQAGFPSFAESGIFGSPSVGVDEQQQVEAIINAINEGEATTTTGDATDSTLLTQIPTNRDVSVIGADGGLFEGGLGKPVTLPPVTVVGEKPPIGTIFDPNALGQDTSGTLPTSTLGGGTGTAPVSSFKAAPGMPEDTPFGKIYNEEMARRNAVRQKEGKQPISASDVKEISELADWAIKEQNKVFADQDVDAQRAARANAAAAAQKAGIPLILPLPIDPTTGLILTAAGLVLSGGRVATWDPNNPVGSVTNAVKGVGATAQNAIDLATGETDLGTIWSGGPAGSTGPGGGSASTSTSVGGQTSSGQTVGAGQGVDPTTLIVGAGGIMGGGMGGSGAGTTGAGQTTGGSPAITGGALGGTVGDTPSGGTSSSPKPSGEMPNTGGPAIIDQAQKTQNILNQILAPSQAINQAAAEAAAAAGSGASTGTGTTTGGGSTGGGDSSTGTGTTIFTGTGTTGGTTPTGDTSNRGTTGVTGGTTGGGGGGGGAASGSGTGTSPGDTTGTSTGGPTVIGTGGGGGTTPSTTTTGPTPATPIFMPEFTFTKTTPGEVALRNFEKEFGLTSSTLMGEPGQKMANFYQQLYGQFSPETLNTLAGTAQTQLQSDLDRLRMAQSGQLSQEDIRSAQQGAREAYAARGQVMGRPAIGAEILNRENIRRQREAEARQNYQQSMTNLAGAAQLQTGNIFAPFAKLIAETYGPTSDYANAVYDYNVNAYNAYQAAQENLAAYKEAAAKGQQAEYINAFANFLAKNGIQTTTQQLSKIFDSVFKASGIG